jgi:hypothetical protein
MLFVGGLVALAGGSILLAWARGGAGLFHVLVLSVGGVLIVGGIILMARAVGGSA